MLMAKVSMSESKKVAGSKIKSKIILSRLVVRWRIFAKSLILWDSLVLCESWGFLGNDSLDSRGLCGFDLDSSIDSGDLCDLDSSDLCVDFGIFWISLFLDFWRNFSKICF